MVHVNVPEYDHQGVTEGWHRYHREPWRVCLEGARAKKEGRGPIETEAVETR
jgi:hypothetical protein